MATAKVRIIWSGQGGELDSVTFRRAIDDEQDVTHELIDLVKNQIVSPGDTFEVMEIE